MTEHGYVILSPFGGALNYTFRELRRDAIEALLAKHHAMKDVSTWRDLKLRGYRIVRAELRVDAAKGAGDE